jgi:hypothetical protein
VRSQRSRRFGIAAASGLVFILPSAPAARADLPGTGIVKEVIGGATGWTFDTMAAGIAGWVLGGVSYFVNGAVDFLRTSARPDVEAVWFAGPGSPYAVVRDVAVVLLIGFVLLGLLQGLVHGDAAGMLRRVAGRLPVAVVGMVATTAVAGRLLALTDALSDAVLSGTGGQALDFLSGFGSLGGATSGFAAVVLGLVAVLAALVLWVELIVRASLVYLLVAISPIGFAATLWPAARGFLRKTVEVLVAVIASKFVICVALSIGVAALAGAGGGVPESAAAPAASGMAPSVGVSLATLLIGAVILALAAFSPFLVLRLIPLAEGALVAQGISRGPARAVQAGAATYSSSRTLSRLGGSSGTGAAGVGATAASPGPARSGPAGTGATKVAGGGSGAAPAVGAAAGAASALRVPFDVSRQKASGQADAARANGSRSDGGQSQPGTPDTNGGGQR